MYSLWSFSSWQLQNCSVLHNVMCTGTVTVLGSVIKLLGDICDVAEQLSVRNVYRYGGYCCMCHGENKETSFFDIRGHSCQLYLIFLLNWPICTNS